MSKPSNVQSLIATVLTLVGLVVITTTLIVLVRTASDSGRDIIFKRATFFLVINGNGQYAIAHAYHNEKDLRVLSQDDLSDYAIYTSRWDTLEAAEQALLEFQSKIDAKRHSNDWTRVQE